LLIELKAIVSFEPLLSVFVAVAMIFAPETCKSIKIGKYEESTV
jgi:hypothetical protein